MKLKFGFSVVLEPVEEYFDYAARYGFGHLEVDLLSAHSTLESFTPRRINRLKKLSKKSGISLSLHAPYTLNLAARIRSVKEANLAYLRRCLLLANKLGAGHLTTHLGACQGLPGWKDLRPRALAGLVKDLKPLLKICAKLKVPLALENVNPLPKASEFLYLGDSAGDIKFLFSRLSSRYLKLCLDIGHAHTAEGALTYIRNFNKKIICVHYHDNNGKGDQHLDIGKGTVPWPRVCSALKRIKFYGPFVSETFNKLRPHQIKDRFCRCFNN